MANELSPGISFTRPRVGTVPILSAATAVAGIVIRTERGPITPYLVGSADQAQKIYGDPYLGGPGVQAIRDYFNHGGTSLWIQRALHYTTISNPATIDAITATLQLSGQGPANTALLMASSPGQHGNSIGVTTTRRDTIVASGGAQAASATTSYVVSDVRRLYVGAQVKIADSVTPTNLMRVILTKIDTANKRVYFSSVTPVGAITIGVVTLEEWDLTIYRNGVFQESLNAMAHNSLAEKNYFFDVVNNNDPVRAVYVQTDNALAASNTVDPRPVNVTGVLLGTTTPGSDGTTPADADYIGDPAGLNGLYSFDIVPDLTMVAIPGRTSATVHAGVITYCEGREGGGQVFGVLAAAQGQTPAQVNTTVTTTENLYSPCVAFYYPWVKIADPDSGQLTTVSPEAMVMGVYARTDANRSVSKAPAGTPDGKLNVLGVERKLSRADMDLIYPNNINPIVSLIGNGICIYGSRTLSKGDFMHVGVQRAFNFFQTSIKAGTQWTVFEDVGAALRNRIKKSITSFLLRFWRPDGTGILKGTKATDAFYVICDESNNTPADENAGRTICRIGLAISNPNEFMQFELVRDKRAQDAQLAALGA